MAEPEDLLSKADALMARHRPGQTDGESYAEIPLLEEVVVLPPEGGDLPVLTELVELDQVEPRLVEPQLLDAEPAPAANLRATLLATLQPEIDSLIEERLRERLEPLVEKLFEDLRGDLQLIVREILSDAIGTTVEQEIERRKKAIKR